MHLPIACALSIDFCCQQQALLDWSVGLCSEEALMGHGNADQLHAFRRATCAQATGDRVRVLSQWGTKGKRGMKFCLAGLPVLVLRPEKAPRTSRFRHFRAPPNSTIEPSSAGGVRRIDHDLVQTGYRGARAHLCSCTSGQETTWAVSPQVEQGTCVSQKLLSVPQQSVSNQVKPRMPDFQRVIVYVAATDSVIRQ